MNRKRTRTKTGSLKALTELGKTEPPVFSFESLVELCRRTHLEFQNRAFRSADIAMVVRNWLIGRHIVEFEQTGADRAKYGSRLIARLADRLKIKGTSASELSHFLGASTAA